VARFLKYSCGDIFHFYANYNSPVSYN